MKKQILFLGTLLLTLFSVMYGAADIQSKAEACNHGYAALHNQFDFHKAEIIFKELVDRYALDDPMRSEPELGLAWTYHMLGDFEGRDLHMSNVKKLLQLPDEMQNYTKDFNLLASSYYSLEGYRQYIYYEKAFHAQQYKDQKKHLLQAKAFFKKARKIATALNNQELIAVSLQGLGTVYEFLSTYENKKNWYKYDNHKIDSVVFISFFALIFEYRSQSTKYFEQALEIRKKHYGEISAPAARSHHKLARSYVLAEKKEIAKVHYETAISIYKELNIPDTNAKVEELTNEYNATFLTLDING